MIEVFFAGGIIMYPLLLCSLITLTIIIERTIFWWKHKNARNPELIKQLCNYAKSGKKIIANVACNDLIVRVLVDGLKCPRSEASYRINLVAEKELLKASSYIIILNTMVTLTPLLGILGTVLGIIESFMLLGDSSITDPLAANSGLAQALITTAFGLSIAMPSLIASEIFNSQSLKLRCELEKHCTELEISLGLNIKLP